jgi:WD40 repeat protein
VTRDQLRVNLPPAIPDHELLRPIGRGAYGEVWLARNVMGAWRAVKIIGRAQFESDRPYEREFAGIRRFEPVSRSSGGLVHVLHVGRNDAAGYFYYVMELADAADMKNPEIGKLNERTPRDSSSFENYTPRTLHSDLKRRGRLPTPEVLRIGLEVANGLAQLHRPGLVHRDVKPGNIIFVNGHAKLADIGLVTAGGEGRTFVGTEGYIPPEGPGTASADIYALGMALYEASAGFAPEKFPDVPPEWFTSAAGDDALELHQVILKACEGRRTDRYPSVDALQADLALLQSGQSVRRLRALKRRYARLRLSGIIGTTLLVCALIGWLFADYRARIATESRAKEQLLREQVQRAQSRAESAERDARQELYAALLEQAKATVHSGELGQRVRAVDAIRRAAAISNSAELRGAALAAMALPDLRFERRLNTATNTTFVRFDPKFDRVALGRGTNAVEIRAVADEQPIATLPATTSLPAFAAQWSRDGRFLAIQRDHPGIESRRDLEIWNVAEAVRRVALRPDGASQRHAPHLVLWLRDVENGALAFHPQLPRVLTGLHDGQVVLWDLTATNELARFRLEAAPNNLIFSPDGSRFAASVHATNWLVSVHDARDGIQLASHANGDFVQWLDWDPRGRWVASADHSGAVQLLDVKTGEARVLGRHKFQAVLVAFSPDGEHLLSGGWEEELIYWDLKRMERVFTITLNCHRAQFRDDGGECALFSNDEAQLFTIENPAGRRAFADDLGPRLRYAAFSSDGRWLAAAASERLGVWDLSTDGPAALSTNAADAHVFFSSRGELLASDDQNWHRWRVSPAAQATDAPQMQPLALPTRQGFGSLCSVSNQIVLTCEGGSSLVSSFKFQASGDQPSRLETSDLDLETKAQTPTIAGVSGVSPDGRWLGIFQPYSSTLHVYRLPKILEVAALTNRAAIARFDFSPRGDEVSVSTHKGVELWSSASWTRTRLLTNFISLLYPPDGRTCWLTSDYRNAGLYDARTFELLLPLPFGTLPLAASPDGRLLAVSADSRRLQVFDLVEVRRRLAELGLDWTH